MNEQEYQILIAKYLAGEASPQEEFALRQWVDLDKQHEARFEAAYATWEAVHRSSETIHPDVDRAWQKVNAQLEDAPQVQTLDMRRAWPRWTRYAAAIVILAGLAGLVRWGLSGNDQPLQYAANDGTQLFELPDSSQVWLSSGSKLSYTPGAKRSLMLEGSAYFEVKRDEQHPFVIQAGQTTVEVLGTSFSVTESDSTVEVRVATGKVAFASAAEKYVLPAGYKAAFDKSSAQIEKSENDNFDFLPGQDRRWVFSDTRIGSIVAAFSSTYGIDVSLSDPGLGNCRFNGSFEQDDPAAMLEVIALTLGFGLEKAGEGFRLSGTPCQ